MPVTIQSRFCGPPGWANGGYSCGSFAELAGAPRRATVTLRKPVALETRLEGRSEEGRTLIEGPSGELVAEVVAAGALGVEPPDRPDIDAATRASADSPFRSERHPYPGCFVCGPEHETGLHIHVGALDTDGELAAAPVTIPPDLLASDGSLPVPLVWAALDCPTYVPSFWGETPLLGRLSVEIPGVVDGSAPMVAVSWARGREGRKMSSAAALLGADGQLLALSEALWINVRA